MASNYIQSGEILQHTPGSDLASGDVVVMGSRVGVALSDIPAGQMGAVQVVGVFALPKAADTIGQGDPVYWDATAGNITTTSTGNTLAGYAAADAATADTLVHVKLNG